MFANPEYTYHNSLLCKDIISKLRSYKGRFDRFGFRVLDGEARPLLAYWNMKTHRLILNNNKDVCISDGDFHFFRSLFDNVIGIRIERDEPNIVDFTLRDYKNDLYFQFQFRK